MPEWGKGGEEERKRNSMLLQTLWSHSLSLALSVCVCVWERERERESAFDGVNDPVYSVYQMAGGRMREVSDGLSLLIPRRTRPQILETKGRNLMH